MMSEKKVKLVLPEVTGWDITPDKIPEEVCRQFVYVCLCLIIKASSLR